MLRPAPPKPRRWVQPEPWGYSSCAQSFLREALYVKAAPITSTPSRVWLQITLTGVDCVERTAPASEATATRRTDQKMAYRHQASRPEVSR
jgi:hypothetical protein